MYNRGNKTYLTSYDVDLAISEMVEYINLTDKKIHLVGLARGSFSIIHKLSNVCNLPYTILQYSRIDKKDTKVKFGFSSQEIDPDDLLLIVDDIADTGISINTSIDYLNECFSWKPDIEVYTIVGGINKNWKFVANIEDLDNNWVVFPWENKIKEICMNCAQGEDCNKNIDSTHCNKFNKSFNNYHSCPEFK